MKSVVDVAKLHRVGRPKEFDKVEVLTLAVDVFAAKGYEGTSIQDLVDAMGINRFSLYEEFGGKHGLFLASLDTYHRLRRNRVVEHFAKSKPALELLRDYLKLIYTDSRQGGAYGCMMVNSACELARTDPEIARRISDHFSKLEEIFVGFLSEAKNRGEITTSKDLTAVARFLLNASRGLRVMVTYDNDQEVFEDISNLALSVLEE